MANYKVNISIDEGIDQFRKFAINLKNQLLREVQYQTPVHTGTLKNAWTASVSSDGTTITLMNDTPYAAYVEFGTDTMLPTGMLATTLMEIDQMVDKALEGDVSPLHTGDLPPTEPGTKAVAGGSFRRQVR